MADLIGIMLQSRREDFRQLNWQHCFITAIYAFTRLRMVMDVLLD